MIKTLKKYRLLLSHKTKLRAIRLVFITIIGAFFEVLGVSLVIPMFSAIMNPDIINANPTISKVCTMLGLGSHKTFVIVCIIALIAVFIIKDLYLVFQYCAQARFVYDARFETQRKVLHAYLCKPYEFYLNASSGEILRVITNDVQESFSLLMTLVTFITESFVSLALVATIFIIDPLMTIAIAFLIGIIILFMSKYMKPRLKNKGNQFRQSYRTAYKWVLQSIEGIKELKITRREIYFEENFTNAGVQQISAEKWRMVYNNTPRLFIELGCVCSTLGVIAVMIYYGKPLEELVPALSAFAVAAVKLMPSALHIVNMINGISFNGAAVDNVIKSISGLDVNGNVYVESKHSLSVKDKIELKNITYKYPNSDKYVLKDASMSIDVGTSVGIVGPSGSGKTTTVDIMLGLLHPEEGKIFTDDKDVMTDYSDWLSHIGYIPQSIFMLDDTIANNVAFGFEPDEEQVWKALKEAQLDEFVRELPDGINTTIGERGVRLSGGQRQRIGIARALYTNPDILVFDEATSSLDNDTESAIMDSINSLHGLKTIIIIAHRLQTIEKCDEVFCVEKTKIIKK